jgi:hypothetical protein
MIKTFQLAGKKYKVKYVAHDTADLGQAKSPLCLIQIQKVYDGRPIPEISQEQTLIHEVVHCIFEELGRNDLSSDEPLVQSLSILIHQFMQSAK